MSRSSRPLTWRHRVSHIALASAAFGLLPTATALAKDYPAPLEALEQEGLEIFGEFDAPGGLTGYAASHQGQPMTVFVTPDGEHAIVGNLIDSEANNLSNEPLERLVQGPQDKATWQQLENSAWIADGNENAERIVYVFTDPNCPYCKKFWEKARPWVESGKVQLRHVMVGILDPQSPRQAVTMLAADDPAAVLAAHESGETTVSPMEQLPREWEVKLQGNHELFNRLGMIATPGLVYQNEGHMEMAQGMPQEDLFNTIMGPR
uniref:thiol:disulfide interchange protein DsbG n=1 Tax=Halomonas sp. TaxID=1486246 RepID=UPI00262A0F5C|nr:thiol:disulfide interchange protein DsbG [Halomonas sp.]